jgi:hypothetical protein
VPGSADGAGARTRTLAIVLAVVVGLTLGIGVTMALTRSGDGGSAATPAASTVPSTPTTAPGDEPPPPGTEASSPQAAVEGFLAAEIGADLEASFGYLSAEARSGFGSPAGWIARHADLLAPVRAYQVEEVDETDVVALVTFEPGLDEVMGLVAERTRVTWATSESQGSWGVDLEASTLEPLHPADDTAPAAVATWAGAHQACAPAPRTWDGNLRGSPALAEQLCGTRGAVEVGPPLPLSAVDAGPFLAAFGPEAGAWARVVAVVAPVPLRAVVAPIGQEWLVIGVLPS